VSDPRVAILEAGKPPAALIGRFGRYPAMFEALLGDDFRYASHDVEAGDLPADPAAYDGYIVTGSPAGVYDPLPWIGALADFLRLAKGQKLVGICFGHQIMAEALGGHVEKSAKGWGIGLHTYPVATRAPWMDDAAAVSIPASHQDQVVMQPPNTDVTVSSVFTPYAGLAWTDRPAISFQFHPEFDPAYARALIAARHDLLPKPPAALASLDAPNDNARVGGWIRRFLLG
jgi:GMP synthase-like glutamine amidotransferase